MPEGTKVRTTLAMQERWAEAAGPQWATLRLLARAEISWLHLVVKLRNLARGGTLPEVADTKPPPEVDL